MIRAVLEKNTLELRSCIWVFFDHFLLILESSWSTAKKFSILIVVLEYLKN